MPLQPTARRPITTIAVLGDITKNIVQYEDGRNSTDREILKEDNSIRCIGGIKEIADFIYDCHYGREEKSGLFQEKNAESLVQNKIEHLSDDEFDLAVDIPGFNYSTESGTFPYAFWRLRSTKHFKSNRKALRGFPDKITNLDREAYAQTLSIKTADLLTSYLDQGKPKPDFLVVVDSGLGFGSDAFNILVDSQDSDGRAKKGRVSRIKKALESIKGVPRIFLPDPQSTSKDFVRLLRKEPVDSVGAPELLKGKLISVFSVDLLRNNGWKIARKLDWESTISDLKSELEARLKIVDAKRDPITAFLRSNVSIIVTFGIVGAVLIHFDEHSTENGKSGNERPKFSVHCVVHPTASGQILRVKESHGDVKCCRRSFVYSLIRQFHLLKLATGSSLDSSNWICWIQGKGDVGVRLRLDSIPKRISETLFSRKRNSLSFKWRVNTLEYKAILKRGLCLSINGYISGYRPLAAYQNGRGNFVSERVTMTPPGSPYVSNIYGKAWRATVISEKPLFRLKSNSNTGVRRSVSDLSSDDLKKIETLEPNLSFVGGLAYDAIERKSGLLIGGVLSGLTADELGNNFKNDVQSLLDACSNKSMPVDEYVDYMQLMSADLFRYLYSSCASFQDVETISENLCNAVLIEEQDSDIIQEGARNFASSVKEYLFSALEHRRAEFRTNSEKELTSTEQLRHLHFRSDEDRPNFIRAEIVSIKQIHSIINKRKGLPDSAMGELLKRIQDICRDIVKEGPQKTFAQYGSRLNANNPNGRIVVPTRTYGIGPKVLHAATVTQIRAFNKLENHVSSYVRMHREVPRPLNIGIFGEPGSGKSYGPQRVLDEIPELNSTGMEFFECNLATMSNADDVIDVFLKASSVCCQGRIPVVLFDEFDSMLGGDQYGWLKYLISPMQDGFCIHHQIRHYFKKSIFLFAGGTAVDLPHFIAKNRSGSQSNGIPIANIKWKESAKTAKVPDFISRLSTSISFSGVNINRDIMTPSRSSGSKSRDVLRKFDHFLDVFIQRAIILRSILEKFSFVDSGQSLNGSFVSFDAVDDILFSKNFSYGSRSMETLVMVSKSTKERLRASDVSDIHGGGESDSYDHHVSSLDIQKDFSSIFI
jgi:hypothetical protein